jgi:hypothetical protein
MDQQLSLALAATLFIASGALVVLAVVLVRVMLRLEKQCERVVTAVERVEAEVTPLARETRVAVDRLSELSGSAQRAADVAGDLLLPPVRAVNQVTRILRTGATAFLRALFSPHTQTPHVEL